MINNLFYLIVTTVLLPTVTYAVGDSSGGGFVMQASYHQFSSATGSKSGGTTLNVRGGSKSGGTVLSARGGSESGGVVLAALELSNNDKVIAREILTSFNSEVHNDVKDLFHRNPDLNSYSKYEIIKISMSVSYLIELGLDKENAMAEVLNNTNQYL